MPLHTRRHCSSLLLFLFFFFFFFLLLLPAQVTATGGDDEATGDDLGCSGRHLQDIDGDSVVCVCDAKGCPTLLPSNAASVSPKTATTFTTSRQGHRFLKKAVKVVTGSNSSSSDSGSREVAAVVEVAVEALKQAVNGFGGALTDSAALTMSSLSTSSLGALLRAYFSPEGLEYTLLRVPIGGCDFSLRPYTYADTPSSDGTLNFALVEEDVKYKLPLLRRILGLSRRSPRVIASPWSAPAWMKDNKKIDGSGELLREMWSPWTEYIIRFIKEYEQAGVPIWAVSTQNHAFESGSPTWNSMHWSPDNMEEWIKTIFGPAMDKAELGRVKVYVGDDNRKVINAFSRQLYNDPGTARYITGVAVHWYTDDTDGPQILEQTHLLYPNKDILYTEACIVPPSEPSAEPHKPVLLGSWERAEKYAMNIIEDMTHSSSGWIDWNLCLDMSGGPNWAGNNVDSPVIINQEKDEFYLQPMFFIMGHFSKFVPPGSVAVESWVREGPQDIVKTAAFIHPMEDMVVLQLLNTGDAEMEVRVEWERGSHLHTLLPSRALQTVLLPWKGSRTHENRKYHCEENICH